MVVGGDTQHDKFFDGSTFSGSAMLEVKLRTLRVRTVLHAATLWLPCRCHCSETTHSVQKGTE